MEILKSYFRIAGMEPEMKTQGSRREPEIGFQSTCPLAQGILKCHFMVAGGDPEIELQACMLTCKIP